MSHPIRHVVHQGPVLKAIGSLAVQAIQQRVQGVQPGACDTEKVIEVTLPPRDPAMVADYIRWAGGDPSAWRGQVPPHLFAQWALAFGADLLCGLPYPLAKAVNAGCRIERHRPLPMGEPLLVRARLVEVDDDGRRAVMKQEFVTGTASAPDALVCRLDALVPLGEPAKKSEKKGKKSAGARPLVPVEAREIGTRRLAGDAGFRFACLTGDFNPLHWIPPWGKALGFGGAILHGFGTLAIALETMNKVLWAGDVNRLAEVEVRFTKPVKLPGRIGIFVNENGLFVGDAPGGPANLTGTFTVKDHV